MGVLKRNIILGTVVCIISLTLYSVFLYISTDVLISIGNRIESFFGFYAEMDVNIFRELIKTVTSGVFGSSIVAIIFYIQEYIKTKQDTIEKIISVSRDICTLFNKIPLVYVDGKEAELTQKYYVEKQDNDDIKETIDELSAYVSSIEDTEAREKLRSLVIEKNKKLEEMGRNDAENELVKYWKTKEETNSKLTDDYYSEQLEQLVLRCNTLIDNSMLCYLKILQRDLSELRDLTVYIDFFFPYNRRRMKRIKEKCEKTDFFGASERITRRYIVERLLEFYTRSIKAVQYHFATNGIDPDNYSKDDRGKILKAIQNLQYLFVGLIPTKIEGTTVYVEYNRMQYMTENVHSLLLCDALKQEFAYKPETSFIRPAKRYYYGQVLTTTVLSSQDMMDILDVYH